MYVVRCDFKNGIHREYGYADIGVAMGTYQAISAARQKSTSAEIFDEGGRQSFLDCRDIIVHELVDVPKETLAAITLMREVQDIQRKAGLLQEEPRYPPPPNATARDRDEAPEYRGAIGSVTFAN